MVFPFSKYGDYWAIIPALMALPIAIILHVAITVKSETKGGLILYGVAHSGFLFAISIFCLILISKDSL